MIFATDLDGTIIFSRRFDLEGFDFLCIDVRKGKEISFITKNSKIVLNQINKSCLLIPTTTRTIKQYKRLELFENGNTPQYVITSNGGNILIFGEVDIEWKNIIQNKLKAMDKNIESIKDVFFKIIGTDWLILHRFCDELYWIFKVELKNIPKKKLEEFKCWSETNGYLMYIIEKKIYVIPKFICKLNALKYLMKKSNKETLISAGDTNLDREMILHGDIRYVPLHAIINFDKDSIVTYTKNIGILAGEEILISVYDKIMGNK